MSEPNPTIPVAAAHEWRQFLFDAHPSPMWIYDRGTLAFLAVNDAAVAHYGYSRAEFLQMKITEIRPQEEIPRLVEFLSKPPLTVNRSGDWRHRKKDGTIIHVEAISHEIDFGGRPARFVLINDITERKQFEQALAASEESYRTIFDSAHDAIFIHDAETGTVLEVNTKAIEMSGYNREELCRPNLWALTGLGAPYTAENALRRLREAAQGTPQTFEWKGRHKSNAEAWLEISLKPIQIAGKGRLLAVVRDISERKRAGATMSAQLAEIEAIYRTAPVGLCLLDSNFRYVRVNERLAELNGVPARDHIGRTVREVVPLLADQTEAFCHQVMTTGKPVLNEELSGETIAQPGVLRTWIANWWPHTQADGRLTGISVTVEEITERKNLEEKLRFAKSGLDCASVPAFWHGYGDRFLYVNDAACRKLGYSREELLTMSVPDIDPNFPAERMPEVWRSLKTHGSMVVETQHRKKSGDTFPVEMSLTYFEFDGWPSVCAFATDITERKRAEELLRQSEERYRLFAESIPVPAWQTNEKGQTLYANRRWYEYTGQTREQFLGAGWLDAIHPDDIRQTRKRIVTALRAGNQYEAGYRLRRHDGAYRWHLAKAYPSRTSAGQLIGWFGTTTDVHDQTIAQEGLERLVQERTAALRESEERYHSLLEMTPIGVAVIADGRFCYTNPECARIFGARDPAELIGRMVMDFTPPEDRVWVAERLRKVIENGAAVSPRERNVLRLDDQVRIVSISSAPITYDGKPAAVSAVLDITEIRRLEREIAEISHCERMRIGQDLHDSVCQQLTGIALACQALQNALTGQSRKLAANAGEIRAFVETALAETRALAQGLAPTELRNSNLAAALRLLAETTARLFAVKCVVDSTPALPAASPEQTFHLYRIAQEAIANAIRHGKAKRIRVKLNHTTDRLTLVVRDNGTGISRVARARRRPGMGLNIMRYRAETIGASLTVERAGRGRGTIVTCSLPVSALPQKPKPLRKRRPAK